MAIKNLSQVKKCLFICNGGTCSKNDADHITNKLRKAISEYNLNDAFHTVRTKCMGRCDDAPVAMLAPDNIWLKHLSANDASFIIHSSWINDLLNTKHFLYQLKEKNALNNN